MSEKRQSKPKAGIGIYHSHNVVVAGGGVHGDNIVGARVVGGSNNVVRKLRKDGTGEVVRAERTRDLLIEDVLHFSESIGEEIAAKLANDVKQGDRAGFLRRVRSLAGKIPVEKLDALMNMAFRFLGN
ncbi:MAG: hypothetical protein KF914_04215 [Rhizobiaceae bacterium]|nr:hypothetical protein [Rhizobiaceae bacterium]